MSDFDKVKYILSHDGSLKLKEKIARAENMLSNPNATTSKKMYKALDYLLPKLDVMERELHNADFSDHEIGVMETYIDKLNQVTRLLRVRIEQQGELQEVDGGRRKSGRRRTSRTRSGRRRTRKRRH